MKTNVIAVPTANGYDLCTYGGDLRQAFSQPWPKEDAISMLPRGADRCTADGLAGILKYADRQGATHVWIWSVQAWRYRPHTPMVQG